MKIAYVNLHWPRTLESGVGKKILTQISLWRENGHDVKFFMHTHDKEINQPLLQGEIFKYKYCSSIKDLLSGEISRSKSINQLINSVREYQPDLIYFRNSVFVFPLHKIFKIAPVVIEVASNDVYEHRGLGLPLYFYNRITRGIALSRASGLVFLSNELANLKYYAKYEKQSQVIGDGVLFNKLPELNAPNNKIPVIAFIGSPGRIWHGVDKLGDLARLIDDIEIIVIGYDGNHSNHSAPKNLKYLGLLNGDLYYEALSKADLAISSLGLHRIHIQEISPLKTRECVAMGIPIILPYTDTDLKGLEIEEIIEIDNDENNAINSAKLIHDFAYRMIGKRIKRQDVEHLIDSSIKESQRISFFYKVTKN